MDKKAFGVGFIEGIASNMIAPVNDVDRHTCIRKFARHSGSGKTSSHNKNFSHGLMPHFS